MQYIDSYIKENDGQILKAEIYGDYFGYSIKYSINGNLVKEEHFPGKSKFFVEDAAQNWLDGIKKLNG